MCGLEKRYLHIMSDALAEGAEKDEAAGLLRLQVPPLSPPTPHLDPAPAAPRTPHALNPLPHRLAPWRVHR